jgi:hypothetical protein
MNHITINKKKISLNPNEIQISPLGREFKFVKSFDNVYESPKIKDNIVIFAKVYMFEYLDDKDKLFFSFDCNDEYIEKINDFKFKEFRLSGISIDYSKQPKYIKGNSRHCTTYSFIYLDTKELFSFYFDEYDKFVNKI